MTTRLSRISAPQAFYLLRNATAIPKTMYTLRTSRPWLFPELLLEWDTAVREAVAHVTKNSMCDRTWTETTLPIREGGLGIRAAGELAVSAYLASVYSVNTLVSGLVSCDLEIVIEAPISLWCAKSACSPPVVTDRSNQKMWSAPIIKQHRRLADSISEDEHLQKARRNAVATPESGAWLSALPAAVLGTLVDDEVFRVCIGLRIGSKLCAKDVANCGKNVDEYAYHGLSCGICAGAGRCRRHTELNETLRRALYTSGTPSILEPVGTSASDNMRPDGLTVGKREETCLGCYMRRYISPFVHCGNIVYSRSGGQRSRREKVSDV